MGPKQDYIEYVQEILTHSEREAERFMEDIENSIKLDDQLTFISTLTSNPHMGWWKARVVLKPTPQEKL